jgi:hypothetical protein
MNCVNKTKSAHSILQALNISAFTDQSLALDFVANAVYLAAQLRTRKERMQYMFLKRREDGSYVF